MSMVALDEDVPPPVQWIPAVPRALAAPRVDEEITISVTFEDEAPLPVRAWGSLLMLPPVVHDEQPGAIFEEDPSVPVLAWPQITLQSASFPDEVSPPAMIDEDPWIPMVVWLQLAPIQLVPQTDDASLPQMVDEDAFAPMVVWTWSSATLPTPAPDEIAELIADDDGQAIAQLPWPAVFVQLAPSQGDEVGTQPAAIIDEDPYVRIVLWPNPYQPLMAPQIDEVGTAPTSAVEEDPSRPLVAWPAISLTFAAPQADDAPFTSILDDDSSLQPQAWAQPQPIQVVYADDEVPAAALEDNGWSFAVRWDVQQPRTVQADDDYPSQPAQQVPDDGWSAVAAWPPPPPVQQPLPPDPEDLPHLDPFAAVVDEDAFLPPVQWAPIWVTFAAPPSEIFSGDLGRRVHIHGTSPDPEVYDGPLSVGLFYGSS